MPELRYPWGCDRPAALRTAAPEVMAAYYLLLKAEFTEFFLFLFYMSALRSIWLVGSEVIFEFGTQSPL